MQPGTRANLACKPGFQLHKEPEFSQINCGNDGIWDNCLFSCEPECGNPTPIETVFNSDPPVTYLAGQYPWYAMLFTRREDLFKGQFLFSCGGSIINSRMIVTTAYCAHKPEIDLDDQRVVVGSSVFRFNKTEDIYAQHYEIEKVIVPKGFDIKKEGNPNNIAIILVKGKFTFSDIIKPICLERHFNGPIEEPEGEIGYVPGYSTDRQTLDTVRFVYNVSLAYISNTSCRNFEYPFKRFYQSYDKFCAGNLSFGYEIPFGFLGGGYFVPDYKSFEPVYFLKGVASAYGRSVNFFGITDIKIHLPWILVQEKNHLQQNEKLPEFCGPAFRANASALLTSSVHCKLPAKPNNGRYFVGGQSSDPEPGTPIGEWSVLKYKCDPGYSLSGSETIFCVGGSWSSIPLCRKMCKPLTSTSVDIYCTNKNEEVPCENPMPAGTTADLTCKKGYTLYYAPDNTRITCDIDGTWNSSPFKCTPECGLATPKGHGLVIGGQKVKVGDFPWHAGIYEKNETNYKYNKQICGGSIINAKTIISAAHCFYPTGGTEPYDKSRFVVAVGKIYRGWFDDRDVFAQRNNIDQLLIPPTYDDLIGNYAQDIALIITQFSMTFSPFVRPICIQWTFRGQEEELRPNTPGIVSGWGLTTENGEPSEELKSITLPSVPRYACRENFPADFRPYLTPGKFCAGYQNGSSVCQGDSGGGLCFPRALDQNTTVYFLRGVVSVGPTRDGSCDSNQYTVFTSVLANLEWLKTHRAHLSV
ncbi:uncharacterized protein LOC113374031 isoform X2 [Ctenocephalides felis]|nr:uncharacterized protein LOC113374031 isoform X2 [Ctenocephalides felis]